MVRGLLEEWGLRLESGEVWGRSSTVVPVTTEVGARAVLKVAVPEVADSGPGPGPGPGMDPGIETEHEALALQRWGGRGAVRLLRADPRRRAVLLERLERRDLVQEWDVHACEAVADLYGLLHVPAPPQLLPLTQYVGRYVEPLTALPRDAPLPRRMVEQCLSHLRDLLADPASTGTMVHGDLHYENVLADTTGEWVAIDPHAMSGDPHWEPAPLLWNRLDEAEGDVRRTVRVRFETVVDAAGLDEDRARAWAVVRLVLNAFWAVRDGDPDPARVTRLLTVLKAVSG